MWFLIVTLFPNAGPLGVLTGHVVAIGLYTILFLKYEVKFPNYFKYLMLGTAFFGTSIFLSLLMNYDQTGFSLAQIRYVLVPFYWIFGLLAGVVDAKIFGIKKRSFFFYIAAIFILLQIPLALSQILGFDSILWIDEKARDWTGILRAVGTVQNPNTLGIISVFCIAIFGYFVKQKPFWSKFLIGITFLLIIVSGSRTSLIAVLCLPIFFIPKEKLFSKNLVYLGLSASLVLLVFYFTLSVLRDALPYMSQLLNLVEGGSVHTLSLRFELWEDVKEVYSSSPILYKFFGLGPGYFKVLDNSYFYVFYNYGIPASLFFIVLLLLLFNTAKKGAIKIAQKGLLVLLICGLVADLMLNFLFMTIIYYFIGLQYYTKIQKDSSG